MSYEQKRLEKLIAYKKQSLLKIENAKIRAIVEAEIMFLEKQILPIIRNNTSLKHSNISTWASNAVDFGEKNKYNGVMFFIPISNEYEKNPTIAIANPNEMKGYRESGAVQIYVKEIEIINMDGSKTRHKPSIIPINEIL